MAWLYVVIAGAAIVRWGLWYLRDAIEWIETPRRDYVSQAMLVRLRLQGDHGARSTVHIPVLRLSEEAVSGPRGA